MNVIYTRMNGLKKWIPAILVVIVVSSCDTKTNEKAETAPDSVVLPAPTSNDLNSNQSALLTAIMGSSEQLKGAVLRGVSFGDPVGKVKAAETFEMFEETADHLGYTSETPQLETIDVQYFFTADKKVNKITVDVYLNSQDATKQLWDAGKKYFTETYAAPKEEARKVSWNNKSVKINMEDVSVGKDFGLKFQFFPADKTALASK